MILGINYMVKNQDPNCFDLTSIDRLLADKFASNLAPSLCPSDYRYYQWRSGGNQPPPFIKHFYTLDIIGALDSTEIVHLQILRSGLQSAWLRRISGESSSSINFLQLANRFEPRIGQLGQLLTRVYYTLAVDGRPALSYLYPPPTLESVELEFRRLGSDLRIYPSKQQTSIAKSHLHTVFVGTWPLSPEHRQLLERNIRDGIDRLNLMANNFNTKSVQVMYHEMYGTPRNSLVSRVYYSFCLGEQ